MSGKDLIERYAKNLRETFTPLIRRDAPVALVDFPEAVNCGYHANWLGEKQLLSELGVTPAYMCSARTYDRAAMASALRSGTILLHGGGIFGDRFPQAHEFRMRVLEEFPENPAILLPTQITFFDTEYLQRSAARLAGRQNLTIFARAVVAEHMFERYFGKIARIELAPDMAFMLGRQPRNVAPVTDIVWVARTDQERSSEQTEAAARLASQPAEKYTLPAFDDGVEIHAVVKQRPPTVLLTDWSSLVFDNHDARLAYAALGFDAQSWVRFSRALHVLSLGRIVITDRLHGHIFCLMLGIPHVLLNDDAGKNWTFYETWSRQSGLCRLARTPADAWSLARAALPRIKEWSGGDWRWDESLELRDAKTAG
jgi:exopolysaccharide biosynthesis predicted pyruvyltransferase EpsI